MNWDIWNTQLYHSVFRNKRYIIYFIPRYMYCCICYVCFALFCRVLISVDFTGIVQGLLFSKIISLVLGQSKAIGPVPVEQPRRIRENTSYESTWKSQYIPHKIESTAKSCTYYFMYHYFAHIQTTQCTIPETRFTKCLWALNPNVLINIYVALMLTIVSPGHNFCTCHDSSAVVTCAKLWPDWIIRTTMRAK